MKLEYNQYCMHDSLLIDGVALNEVDLETSTKLMRNFLKKASNKLHHTQLKSLLISIAEKSGEYLSGANCETCGNTDYSYTLEID
jgi:hypothetical protein